jgi:hypothetical protein
VVRRVLIAALLAAAPSLAAEPVRGVLVAPPNRCLPARDLKDPQSPHPRVVSSYPAPGATVRPGILVVSVTFDLPMTCNGQFAADPPLLDPCPGGDRVMTMSPDRRTIRTTCQVAKNRRYGLWLNRRAPYDFIGLSGWPAEPYELTFITSDGPRVKTLAEAMSLNPSLRPAP